MKNKALYPFGYGLSYSKFELRDLTLSKTQVNAGEPVELSLTIENKGDFEADEVVQIYIKDMEASTRVPNWQLYGIKNVHLKPSESMRVSAEITPRAMALIDDEGNCVLEPGKFTVYTGTSQPDSRSKELTGQKVLSAMFEVTGKKTAIEY
jgi:beta-glucosidase